MIMIKERIKMKHYKLVFVLSIVIIALSLFASMMGVLSSSIYQDNETFITIWRSNDIITLIIALPLLIFIMFRSVKHLTPRLLMSWIGLLWYLFYNYAYYNFGAAFNKMFLVHLLIYTLCIPALIYGFIDLMKLKLQNEQVKQPFYKLLGGYMLFIAFGLGFVYSIQSFNYVINDQLPAIITLSGHVTSIVFILDFSMVIVGFVITALYLLKKNPIGLALAYIFNLKSVIYMSVLSFSSYRIGSNEVGMWLMIGLLSVVALLLSYKHLNRELIKDKNSK